MCYLTAVISPGNDSLSRSCAIQSVLILCLRALATLESTLSLPPSSHRLPLASSSSSTHTPTALADLLVASSREAFFRPAKGGVFVSGPDEQVSWASAAWAVIAGVTTGEEAKTALRKAYLEGGVEGVSPYLHHYVSRTAAWSRLNAEADQNPFRMCPPSACRGLHHRWSRRSRCQAHPLVLGVSFKLTLSLYTGVHVC